MRKNTKKAVCILFAVFLLACSFPISAFAVDPISASAIANGFAQAITAYGASHGVSMTFDGINSGNTAQIGQSVHDLWARFRAGQQTADDYDTIAAAVFPGLYNKVIKAGGTAVVGLHIAQEYMPDIDAFWNWLLSGPAEMVKVDNAYQWNSSDGVVSPVVVQTATGINGYRVAKSNLFTLYNSSGGQLWEVKPANAANNDHLFAYRCTQSGSEFTIFFFDTTGYNYIQYRYKNLPDGNFTSWSQVNVSTYYLDGNTYCYSRLNPTNSNIPLCALVDNSYAPDKVLGLSTTMPAPSESSVSVQPYVGDAVAKPVPLPDVGDPDYGPVPWAGDLDVPWNDTLFGDGTGTLTDAQKGAITEELDGVIENDGTLTLEGDQTAPGPDEDEDDPPSDDPGDYGVVGLENIFPFCIPFDIYNFLNALAATPTAPHFTATLQLPAALGGAQTIDLNFDNPTFNQLAQLLRLLELLAFIVGLALLTRSMFIRG